VAVCQSSEGDVPGCFGQLGSSYMALNGDGSDRLMVAEQDRMTKTSDGTGQSVMTPMRKVSVNLAWSSPKVSCGIVTSSR
jgi:hypothetical protein